MSEKQKHYPDRAGEVAKGFLMGSKLSLASIALITASSPESAPSALDIERQERENLSVLQEANESIEPGSLYELNVAEAEILDKKPDEVFLNASLFEGEDGRMHHELREGEQYVSAPAVHLKLEQDEGDLLEELWDGKSTPNGVTTLKWNGHRVSATVKTPDDEVIETMLYPMDYDLSYSPGRNRPDGGVLEMKKGSHDYEIQAPVLSDSPGIQEWTLEHHINTTLTGADAPSNEGTISEALKNNGHTEELTTFRIKVDDDGNYEILGL